MQAVSEMSYDSSMRMVDNAELRDAWRAARSNSVTEDQQLQLRWFLGSILRIQQNRFNQVKLGIIDLEDALQMGGRAGVYREPYFSEVWASAKQQYPVDFQQFMEQHVLMLSEEQH